MSTLRPAKRRKIRSEPEDSAHHTGSASGSKQHNKLFSLVPNLPQELFDQIQDYVFESSLCPGFIFPQQPSRNGVHYWNGKSNPTVTPDLLLVSKTIRDKYQKRLWSENTWVIGTGPSSKTIGFLKRLEQPSHLSISKFHITFTFRDLPDRGEEYYPKDMDGKTPEDLRELYSNWHTTAEDRIEDSPGCFNALLLDQWLEKLMYITYLSPTQMTLDFSECYGAYKCWLGASLACEFRRTARNCVPGDLRVVGIEDEDRIECIMKNLKGYYHDSMRQI
ncbi:MAG: hypothetical protein L6R42_004089 [Xanthoria sp. 1 TBL-2021]|nr:MAG: hypothetical protein L6R42_004089 [Xanthoria sp. 1 TBL-2021]